MFRGIFSPIIRSTWLYLQYLVYSIMDELERSSNSSMTPAGSNLGEHYQILWIQSNAPDDGHKHRPKHVELTWNNKLTYIVAYCWLLSQLYHDARIHEHQTATSAIYEDVPKFLSANLPGLEIY